MIKLHRMRPHHLVPCGIHDVEGVSEVARDEPRVPLPVLQLSLVHPLPAVGDPVEVEVA
eukprot:CAMPEP_0194342072 /NCGR_PEP_ID=MMETSP0171-20130528/91686_1 /TAXON_ID=218684 /ORGANISM="Corethron pennatum, Strain L29A3" /LENGTH=58 /DNA_ID=CAMNT_0039107649 /DNA_START=168 /DNA_END=341 /DNA_ORIENTATION=-